MRVRQLLTLFPILAAAAGCGAIVEPGHRGLLFSPRRGGLQTEVLAPGYHRVGYFGRLDDFDVTYSTRKEDIHTISSEGLTMDVRVDIIFRPIVAGALRSRRRDRPELLRRGHRA